MRRLTLPFLILWLGACTSQVKVPQFEFTIANCQAVANDPTHEYHNNDFVVTGCNHIMADAEERGMWDRANEYIPTSTPADNRN